MQDKSNATTAATPGHTAIAASIIAAALLSTLPSGAVWAQKFPISPQQRATAQQTAARGVPVADLAPNAPDTYVVKRGDTLWAISGIYLKQPWRWPELWGMNLKAIANPHLIYPGQTLYLDRTGGYARLRTGGANETIRVSPRTRYESLSDTALPTLNPQLIEPFLVEPEVVDELSFEQAPRIVATRGEHTIMGNGERAYARGSDSKPLGMNADTPRQWRVYRNVQRGRDERPRHRRDSGLRGAIRRPRHAGARRIRAGKPGGRGQGSGRSRARHRGTFRRQGGSAPW